MVYFNSLQNVIFPLFLSPYFLIGSYSSTKHKITTIGIEPFFLLLTRVLFSFSSH
jgi:hypothetical protein